MKRYGRMDKLIDRVGEPGGTIGELIKRFDNEFNFDEIMVKFHSLRSLDLKSAFLREQIHKLDYSYEAFVKGVLKYLSDNYHERLDIPILSKDNSFSKSYFRKFEDFIIRLIQNMDVRTFGIHDFLNLQCIELSNPAKYFKIRSRLEDLTQLVKDAKKFSQSERVSESMTFRYELDLIEHFCHLIKDHKKEVFYLKFIKQEYLAAKKRESELAIKSNNNKLPDKITFIRSIEKLQRYRMTEKDSLYVGSESIDSKKRKGSIRGVTFPVERIVWEGSKNQLKMLFKLLGSAKYMRLDKQVDSDNVINSLFEFRRAAPLQKDIADGKSKHSHRGFKIKWLLTISSLIGLADLLEEYQLIGKDSYNKWNHILVRFFIQNNGKPIKGSTIHMRRFNNPKKFRFEEELKELVKKVSKHPTRKS